MGNQIEGIEWRERIEWSNIWWEKANDAGQKRIALLGDSVTREFRSKLNARLAGRYVVDLCASSTQITDSLLWREYQFFFECSEWKYNKIFLQTGGQHGHERQCCSNEEYCELFKTGYRKLVDRVSTYCSDITIVSFTPTVEKDNLEKLDEIRNRELAARDRIISNIADELSIPYIDIWNPLLTKNFNHRDFIHYNNDANEFIADYLLPFINESVDG